MWVNASTRASLDMTPYTPCLSPTPPLPHSSFHPYLFICHPLTIPLNINLIYWREPFLVPPLPHYVSNMFLLCFYGSFFLDATDFHSRIPYVVINDQTPGSIIIYLPPPPPHHPSFISYPTTTSTVSVWAVLVPLPFGRPTFKVPLARFASNSAIRN